MECVVCGAQLPWEQAGPPLASTVATSERKHLTIMFADLCGSTERIAEADPEQARRLLDAVIARMVSAVRSFGGFVPQISGDGIVALFGAPLAFEDHALRACHAARHVHALIAELSARSGLGDGVRVRVAIHSDTVVVTPTGEPGLAGCRVYGSPVHLAARVEQLCPPGHTLITTATARHVAPRWSLGPPVDHLVKGFQTPVTVMALGAERAAAALPSPVRIAAPLIGRQNELQQLRTALAETRQMRRGRLILLQGEAGIGKSRLVRELMGGLDGWRVLAARGDPFLSQVPAAPLACLLRDALGIRAPVLPEDAAAAARAVARGGALGPPPGRRLHRPGTRRARPAAAQRSAGGAGTFVTNIFEKNGTAWQMISHHSQMIPK
jgi:class 3 adenylate cyclase